MTAALKKPIAKPRLSVPAPGSSLLAATEVYALHVRAAVETVRHSFGSHESVCAAWADVLASRWREEPLGASKTPALQAAWGLVSMRIIGRSIGALTAHASLRDAEAWFLGHLRPPRRLSSTIAELADREAIKTLEAIAYDDALRDLLPYVLDAHGPGSRASVMKAPVTQKARNEKRSNGVFYTPSDVAEYIARETVDELGPEIDPLRVLDPACGSGVFLKAALDLAVARNPILDRFDYVERNLFGIDTNPLAVEAACFVLLHECLGSDHWRQGISPWSLWHRIRCNLCVADSLTLELSAPNDDLTVALASLRTILNDAYVPPSTDRFDTDEAETLFSRGTSLGSVLPALSHGADVLIGNPPYAAIGSRNDTLSLERRFASLTAGNVSGSNFFPAFVEMMWLLARPGRSSSGMVVPLSLACSSRAQMIAIRQAIMGSGGRWRFAFFDREPHALFGEEVKTRNSIIFRCHDTREATATATIETGPLRKWTSRQRARLFDEITFTPLKGISIAGGIPKLSGEQSSEIFGKITRRNTCLHEMCVSVGSCRPEEVASASENRSSAVFVSGTAYNFINAFRQHRNVPPLRAPWSTSKVLSLGFATEDEAARAFAILGSRVAYWLWRVTEDGFHVTQAFVLRLPISDRLFNETQRDSLTRLGNRLWDEVQADQIVSVNGGRQTVAYRPHACESLRDEIDALILGELDVAPSFIEYLRKFVRSVVAVDDNDGTRGGFTSPIH